MPFIVSSVTSTEFLNVSPPCSTRWPHGADLVQRSDRAVVLVRQRGEDGRNRLGVVLHVAGELNHLVGAQHSLLEVRALDADALDQALGLDGLVVHVDQLDTSGRRSQR